MQRGRCLLRQRNPEKKMGGKKLKRLDCKALHMICLKFSGSCLKNVHLLTTSQTSLNYYEYIIIRGRHVDNINVTLIYYGYELFNVCLRYPTNG